MIALLLVPAFAVPLDDAVRLYLDGAFTCAVRAGGGHVCWGHRNDRAVPRAERVPSDTVAGPPCVADGRRVVCGASVHDWPTAIEQVVGTCALGDGEVHCVGDAWRFGAGMPPGTPVDRPVPVEALRGASELGATGPLGQGERLCAIVDAQRRCFDDRGHLNVDSGFPPVRTLVDRTCVITTDDELWCAGARGPERVRADTTLASGRYVRDGGGAVFLRRQDNSEIAIDLPPMDAAEGSLVASHTHGCAIVGGRVGCWGKDDENQRGDGGGRSARWQEGLRAQAELSNARLPCAVVNGTLSCDSPAPWADPGYESAQAPLVVHDVATLSLGPEHGCVVQTTGQLRCFGRLLYARLSPDVPLLTEIVDVASVVNVAALGQDGRLHVLDLSTGSFEAHGPLEGARRVVSETQVTCAQSDRDLLCVDHNGPIALPPPPGVLESVGEAICVQGEDLCLFSSFEALPLDVTWVEAGW